jgi:hypothetical protein
MKESVHSFGGKTSYKTPKKSRRRSEVNTAMDLWEVCYEDGRWMGLAQDHT